MRLAVIPARGGSKRIPRKNIREFCGKPMIAWSIEAALQSGCFDRVLVSTDDLEIAQIAVAYGAEAPFVRPAELSDDYVGTIPVIAHAINWQKQNGEPAADVCCIYATAPFIRITDLRAGYEQLQEPGCDYAFTVTSFEFPIQRAFRITPQGRVEMFDTEQAEKRSQDLEEAYHDAGQFYWGRAQAWLEHRQIFSRQSVPVILPHYQVQDIDTLDDWLSAEIKFQSLKRKK